MKKNEKPVEQAFTFIFIVSTFLLPSCPKQHFIEITSQWLVVIVHVLSILR